MAAVEVPQTLEYRGGQLNAAPVLEVEYFTNISHALSKLLGPCNSLHTTLHVRCSSGILSRRRSIFSSCYLFRNPFSSTTMGDKNHIRAQGDYSKPSHEGYRNTIELPERNNVVPLQSDTIRLVQNECSFHGFWSEDPNQHLRDFFKLVDSFDLDGENRERTRLRLFQFSLRDQASNWLERLPAGSISTWHDLTTRFLAQFFPPGRTAKLRNDILMF
ncbi:zinc finger, CCHC-type containing protein [Tanacetum coccineum]